MTINAKRATPEYRITLDRERVFCLDYRALCELEKRLGKNIFKAMNWAELGAQEYGLLLWAGLLSDDPGLTYEELQNSLTIKKITEVMPLIQEALGISMPEPTKTPEEAAEKKEPTAT